MGNQEQTVGGQLPNGSDQRAEAYAQELGVSFHKLLSRLLDLYDSVSGEAWSTKARGRPFQGLLEAAELVLPGAQWPTVSDWEKHPPFSVSFRSPMGEIWTHEHFGAGHALYSSPTGGFYVRDSTERQVFAVGSCSWTMRIDDEGAAATGPDTGGIFLPEDMQDKARRYGEAEGEVPTDFVINLMLLYERLCRVANDGGAVRTASEWLDSAGFRGTEVDDAE